MPFRLEPYGSKQNRKELGRLKFHLLPVLLSCALLLGASTAGCSSGLAAEENTPVATSAAQAAAPAEPEPSLPTREDLAAFSYADTAPEDPWYDGVCYAAYKDVLLGGTDGFFHPDGLVDRAAAATVLYRMSGGVPPKLAESLFPDVPTTAWYALPVAWGLSSGLVNGTPAGNFEPDRAVTRAELAALLYRFAQSRNCDMACTGDLSAWLDAGEVAEYARVPFSWALEHGVFAGLVSDRLHPELPVSRGQLSQILLCFSAAEGEPLAMTLAPGRPVLPQSSKSRDHHAEIQAVVDEMGQKYGAVGIQVAVIEDGRVSDSYAYGLATYQEYAIVEYGQKCIYNNSSLMTADHKMRVASISKVLIGTAAMLLREEGVIDLDESIGTYWGAAMRNPYYPDAPVSIRSILSHTSSIRIGDVAGSYSSTRARLTSSSGYSRIVPGSIYGWGYNNYAFGVLGMTLELAAGQVMDDILDSRLFATMGIDAAFEPGEINGTDRLVTLYEHGGGVSRSIATQQGLKGNPTPGASGAYFPGGLTISANDLGKVAALLASDGTYEGVRLLSEDSVALMETPSEKTVGDGFYQCLPLRYRQNIYGRDGLYYHTGSAYGVYNCLSYDSATGDGVVVLTTGASATKDSYGIYAICGAISECVYRAVA